MLKVYIAVKTESEIQKLNDRHLTLCFLDVNDTSKLDMTELSNCFPANGIIKDIVYWEKSNVTVALIENKDGNLYKAKKLCEDAGFSYDMEFVPHVTLGKNDLVEENSFLKDECISFASPYIRLKNF